MSTAAGSSGRNVNRPPAAPTTEQTPGEPHREPSFLVRRRSPPRRQRPRRAAAAGRIHPPHRSLRGLLDQADIVHLADDVLEVVVGRILPTDEITVWNDLARGFVAVRV